MDNPALRRFHFHIPALFSITLFAFLLPILLEEPAFVYQGKSGHVSWQEFLDAKQNPAFEAYECEGERSVLLTKFMPIDNLFSCTYEPKKSLCCIAEFFAKWELRRLTFYGPALLPNEVLSIIYQTLDKAAAYTQTEYLLMEFESGNTEVEWQTWSTENRSEIVNCLSAVKNAVNVDYPRYFNATGTQNCTWKERISVNYVAVVCFALLIGLPLVSLLTYVASNNHLIPF